MKRNLPLHPSKRHPLTGEPLRALWVRPDGRAMWPIMGGAPDEPPAPAQPAPPAPTPDPPAPTPPASDAPPAPEPDKDAGFPANTPVAQMTVAQQAAYWQHQSRKHETRATEYRQAVGGKTAAEVQAELDQLRRNKMTADERAIDDAKRQGREEATREYGPQSVRAAFDLLLGDMPETERNAEIELLDLSKFITDSGAIDTAKVRRAAEKIAPADKGTGGRQVFDFGAGNRGDGAPKGGVAAGADLFAASRKKSTQPTS